MKLFISTILLTISFSLFAQPVPKKFQPQPIGGAPNYVSTVKGAFRADSSTAIRQVTDTTSQYVGDNMRSENGLLIKKGKDIFMRDTATKSWVKQTAVVDSNIYIYDYITADSIYHVWCSLKNCDSFYYVAGGGSSGGSSIIYPNLTAKYLNGFGNFGNLQDTARSLFSITNTGSGNASYNNSTGVFNIPNNSLGYPYLSNAYLNGYGFWTTLNTDSLGEGSSKLFFTNARARAAISLTNTGTGVSTYNNSTGVLNIPNYAVSSWSVLGNSGHTWNTNFIGTTDLQSFRIRTNNKERVVIDSSKGRFLIKSEVYQPATVAGADFAFKVTDSIGSNLFSVSEVGEINVGSINAANVPISGIINLMSSQSSGINFYQSNTKQFHLGARSSNYRIGLLLGDSAIFSTPVNSSTSFGKMEVPPVSSVVNISSKNRGVLLPRMTKAERDLINNGISAGTLAGGSGYINGTYNAYVATGGSGTGLLVTVIVSGGVVTSFTIAEQGVGYLVGDVITVGGIPSGSGLTYTVTAVSPPLAGLEIYQTDNTPGKRTYNGTNWMRYTETAD